MERRIGVYICHCGTNIAGVVDVDEVTEFAKRLDSVVVARNYKYICSDPGQSLIKEDIKEYGLNRVVVASCSPRMHEPTFRRTCQNAGLNPYLLEMANIREHCSWVHMEDKQAATEKTKALVRGAVQRVFHHEPLETREVPVNPNTLVVGGGIAGIQAALQIANSNHKVYLVEKEPSIGGHMIQLDKTFPTLDCSACILTPKMSEIGSHPYVELLTFSEIVDVSGFVGNFKVKVRKKARHIDESKCVGCSVCEEKCPWKTDSEFEMGLAKRKAIYIPFPQAIPHLAVVDPNLCAYIQSEGKKCGACIKFCEAQAITPETLLKQVDQIVEIEVGSIILATGYDQFDPIVMAEYGYKKYDNVLTGLEFERMVNASGPTGGRILLKDGQEPKSVGIIHCVGSRDVNYHEYCSRVCCMYALKFSHLLKEHIPGVEIYQSYIDMRCFGKSYEEFYNRLLKEGVNFVRGRVGEVTNVAETAEEKGKLVMQVEDTLIGQQRRIPVDMVVLCCAIEPRSDSDEIARLFRIGKSADGFFLEKHPKLAPVATFSDGIYVVGCCQGPKDIPDTVAQASAAAAEALSMLSKGVVEIEVATAVVNEELCSGCKICYNLCPYTAISFDGEKAVCRVNDILCKGCGVCGAACPSGAIISRHFTTEEIVSQIEGMLV